MTLEYKCDMCGIELKMQYGEDRPWRADPSKPVGVGVNKYNKVYERYTLVSEDLLLQLYLKEVDLCQKCMNKCLNVGAEETTQIMSLSYQRSEKMRVFLAANLQQFKGEILKDEQGRARK